MRRKIRKQLKKRQEKACDTVDSSLKGELPTTGGNVYGRLGTKASHGRRRAKIKHFKKRKNLREKRSQKTCRRRKKSQNVDEATKKYVHAGKERNI